MVEYIKPSEIQNATSASPTTDYLLVARNVGGSWVYVKVPLALGRGGMADLADVDLSGLSAGDQVVFDGAKFKTMSPIPTLQGTAPPSAGTHAKGTICYNTALSEGAPYAWVCIETGTPGRWAVMTTVGTAYPTPAQSGGGGQPVPVPTTTPPPAPDVTFDPTTVAALDLWADLSDATKVTVVSGKVSAITDKSHTHNFSQADATKRPTYSATGIHNKPSLQCDGTTLEYVAAPAAAGIDNLWVGGGLLLAVINAQGAGSSSFGIMISKGNNWSIEVADTPPRLTLKPKFSGVTNYFFQMLSSEFDFTKPILLEIEYNSDDPANQPKIWMNGSSATLNSVWQPDGGTTYDNDSGSELRIGTDVNGTNDYQGFLSELMLFNTVPSDPDRVLLRSYLGQKWLLASGGGGFTPSPTPPTSFDLPSGAVPSVVAMQGIGYACKADYTFGSTAGTIKTLADMLNYFATAMLDGGGNYTVTRLNDEWEYYNYVATQTHVMNTDHLVLNATKQSSALFDANVARCLADTQTVDGNHPDGHYWGSYFGTTSYDCGISSGCITAKRVQKHGYFEIKMQPPNSSQNGAWPAFWCIDSIIKDGAWPPEIDIFENVINNHPENSFISGHRMADRGNNPSVPIASKLDQWGDYSGGFDQSLAPHIYALQWEDEGNANGDHLKFYVDQVCVWDGYYPWRNAFGVPSGPAVFMINMAFGGDWPGRGGGIPGTAFPVGMKVYWFRMFSK